MHNGRQLSRVLFVVAIVGAAALLWRQALMPSPKPAFKDTNIVKETNNRGAKPPDKPTQKSSSLAGNWTLVGNSQEVLFSARCRWRERMSDPRLTMTIDGSGHVTSASLRSFSTEEALGRCPLPVIPPNLHTYHVESSTTDEATVYLKFTPGPGNAPRCVATFSGWLDGSRMKGVLSIQRTDIGPPLNWKTSHEMHEPQTAATAEPQHSIDFREKPVSAAANQGSEPESKLTAPGATESSVKEPSSRTISHPLTISQADAQNSVSKALYLWKVSFQRKDLAANIGCYAPVLTTYFRAHNVSRERILQDKAKAFAQIAQVRTLDLQNLQISLLPSPTGTNPTAPPYVEAIFTKEWNFAKMNGETFAGKTIDKLTFATSADGWKITSEEELKVLSVRHGR